MGKTSTSHDAVTFPWLFDRQRHRHLAVLGASNDTSRQIRYLESVAVETMETFPAGSVEFLFVDVSGIGGNFGDFGTLRNASSDIISGEIVTEKEKVGPQLNRMRRIIGEFFTDKLVGGLRDIDEYNDKRERESGSAGEPYRFVFITDFPKGFDASSCEILTEILQRGSACGVHVFLNVSPSEPAPYGVDVGKILGHCTRLEIAGSSATTNDLGNWATLAPLPPVSDARRRAVVGSFGQKAKARSTSIYSFENMMQAIRNSSDPAFSGLARRWSGTTTGGVVMPLGLNVGGQVEFNVLGKGEGDGRHATLVLGATGMGKSNLLHVIINSMTELYSPDEVSLYLVDGKSGAEFKDYADYRLPHAEVVSLHTDSDFAFSLLETLNEEVQNRNAMIARSGAKDFQSYRSTTGQKLPRILAVFDEFQTLIDTGDRQDDEKAKALFKSIAKQGRSAGVHLVLATQSIGGIDLDRDTLEQIAIRICLSPVASSTRVLSSDNRGSEGLRRYQALNNTARGETSGNSVFQVAKADDEKQKHRIAQMAEQWSTADRRMRAGPSYVFRGNLAAALPASQAFRSLVMDPADADQRAALPLLVGEPIAVAPSHALKLMRRTAGNALFMARSAEEVEGPIMTSFLSALASRRAGEVEIDVLDATMGSGRGIEAGLACLASAWPEVVRLHRNPDGLVTQLLSDILELITARRAGAPSTSSRILAILGLQELPSLRSARHLLEEVLRLGPGQGVHVIGWCDTRDHLREVADYGMAYFGAGAGTAAPVKSLAQGHIDISVRSQDRIFAYELDKLQSGEITPVRGFSLPDNRVIQAAIRRMKERELKHA